MFCVFSNIDLFIFKFINIVSIIAPIPSIEINTFVYLNSSENTDMNPINDIAHNSPLPLYLIDIAINTTSSSANITKEKPIICCFDISEYTYLLFSTSYSIGYFPASINIEISAAFAMLLFIDVLFVVLLPIFTVSLFLSILSILYSVPANVSVVTFFVSAFCSSLLFSEFSVVASAFSVLSAVVPSFVLESVDLFASSIYVISISKNA